MLKFWEFSNFLENSHFCVRSPGNSLLGTIFSIRHNLENRNDDDAPQKIDLPRQVIFRFRHVRFSERGFYFLSLPGKCVSITRKRIYHVWATIGQGLYSVSIHSKCVFAQAKTHLSRMDTYRVGFVVVSIHDKRVSTLAKTHLLGMGSGLCIFFCACVHSK